MRKILPELDGVILVDSVNYLSPVACDQVVVASSHGGIYAAYKAAACKARAVILNDAGVGLDDAGIACISYCEKLGMAAAVVSNLSARIGDVADMMERGVISFVNREARNAGCHPDMSCSEGAAALRGAMTLKLKPPVYAETRFIISAEPNHPHVVCIDSASLVEANDTGQIVITGSHGGLIGGMQKKAFNVDALLAVFNDAGIGIDEAGIGRLEPLDKRNVAAVTVSHTSARIGDSQSTYHDGIISHTNSRASDMGAFQGMPIKAFVKQILD